MTAPFEIEEPEPIPLSGLVKVRCTGCRAEEKVACAPDQAAVALCGGCRTQVASSAATIRRLPAVPPPLMVWSGSEKILAEDGAGRAEVLGPEFACGAWPTSGVKACKHVEPSSPVTRLYLEADELGWRTEMRHSRGGVMGGAGKQLAVADIWSVRFRRGAWAGYAVRRGEAWDSVCITGATLPPFLALGVTELRAWLADPDQPASWYNAIRERVAAQDLAKKMRACPGPGECPWVDEGRGDHTHRANGDIKIKSTRKQAQHGQ